MSAQLTHIHLSIIKNMMLSQSYKHMAELLGFSVATIEECVKELTADTSLVTRQQKLDARISARPVRIKKVPAKIRAVNADIQHKDTLRAIRNKIAGEREHNNRRRESVYKTIAVDYTQMVLVKVDDKTFIYAKPGQEEKSREAYRKKHPKSKTD